jgi:hypothetical protein
MAAAAYTKKAKGKKEKKMHPKGKGKCGTKVFG